VIDVIQEEQAEDLSEIAGADVEEAEEAEEFSWRTGLSRFSWLAVNMTAGFILALVIYQVFGPLLAAGTAFAQVAGLGPGLHSHYALSGMVCLLPMMLMTSGSAGSQALGIAGWRLRAEHGGVFWRGIFRELGLGTFGGILTCVLAGILAWLLFRSLGFSVAIGLAFGVTLLVAYVCGLTLPHGLQFLRLRGSLITAPLLDPLISVLSVCVFLLVTLELVTRLGS
jgi:Mg/Co/Ni transporter MgtE